jgi:hypothetical protein
MPVRRREGRRHARRDRSERQNQHAQQARGITVHGSPFEIDDQ